MTVPGGSPLNYPIGTQPPIRRISQNRAPTVNDYKNWREGDEWLDSSSNDWYKLANVSPNNALWVRIGGSGGPIESFIPDSGTSPVVPNDDNEITISGQDGLEVVGSLNTLTITSSNGQVATKFLPDTGTSPVVPDANGEITLAGGTNLQTVGSANTVTFNVTVSPGLLPWNVVTDPTQAIAVNNGYIANAGGGVSFSLPAIAAVGDVFAIVGVNAGGWSLSQGASQEIQLGSSSTTPGAGGSLSSTAIGDAIFVVCWIENTHFVVINSMGNITFV